MKIQYASDLHLEFRENQDYLRLNPLIPTGEILLLAGDICLFSQIDYFSDFFDFLSDNFAQTYWIPGNHEYYRSDLSSRNGHFTEAIRSNVHLLNNTSVIHNNIKLIFSTLWSEISDKNAWAIQYSLNDFQVIRYGNKNLNTELYNQMHRESLNFIKAETAQKDCEKLVVVTHHVPTFQHYPKEYQNSNINEAFATDLDHFIESSNIDYWIYGHHHRNNKDFTIGNCKLLTNQLGYVRSGEHKGFGKDRLIY